MKAGINISRLLSKALFNEAYNNQIWIVTFKINMNIKVESKLFNLLGFAWF